MFITHIESMEYTFNNVVNGLSPNQVLPFLKGSDVSFSATPAVDGWLQGEPSWSGSSGASGSGQDSVSVSFDTVSSSAIDYKTVTCSASCEACHEGCPSEHTEFTVNPVIFDIDKLTLTDGSNANNKKQNVDVTSPTEPLYLVQNQTGQASVNIDASWLPADLDRGTVGAKLLWKIEDKNGGVATGWTSVSGNFVSGSQTLNWTSSGTGCAREFVVKAGGDANGNNTLDPAEEKRSIEVVVIKVVVDKIAFNYNSSAATEDALNIREDYVSGISVPEYVKGGQNKPAAYIKDSAVKLHVSFKVEPDTITSVKIKGVSNDTDGSLGDATEKDVSFSGGVSDEGGNEYAEFSIDGNTPNQISSSEEVWKWTITEVESHPVTDLEFEETSGHKIYVILLEPKEPWNQIPDDPQNPWVEALDFVIDSCGANGMGDDAIENITSYLHTGHGLSYAISHGGAAAYADLSGGILDLTNYLDPPSTMNEVYPPYTLRNGDIVCCYDQAAGVNVLASLLGISTELVFVMPFGYIQKTDLVGWGDCNNPFPANVFELLIGTGGVTDNVRSSTPSRVGFGNHAFVDAGGQMVDACAGPHLGTETYLDYCTASIDISSAAESAESADGLSYGGNADLSFTASEVDSVRYSTLKINILK